jgi:thiol-disulfide isomerase/thioredoxin
LTRLLYLVLLCLWTVNASAQNRHIPVIRLFQLEERLLKGADTTFVVNLWATWCGPCVKELPYFEALDTARAKVLLVSLDFEDVLATKVIPFVQQRKLRSEVMLLNEDNPNDFIPRVSRDWSGAIPATLFINEQRGVRYFFEGSVEEGELENKLESLGL